MQQVPKIAMCEFHWYNMFMFWIFSAHKKKEKKEEKKN